jgi:hypothetical protein
MVYGAEAGVDQDLLERVFDRIDNFVPPCLEAKTQGDEWIEIAARSKGRDEDARHGIEPSLFGLNRLRQAAPAGW